MTQPMTRDQLTAWLRLHCDDATDITPMLDEFAGRTEDEMDELADAQHGSMA